MSVRTFGIPLHCSPFRRRRPRLRLPTISGVGCVIPRVLGFRGLGLGGGGFRLGRRLFGARGPLSGSRGMFRRCVGGSITGIQWWRGLLSLGLVQERRLAGPSFIGESSKLLDLRLADQILLLFLDSRRIFSDVAKPLMPLSWGKGCVSVTACASISMEAACCGEPPAGFLH